ncbi:MAG: phosphoglucomutase (alpha-D-glucose-1,6-bisphosphate-dependent) [Thermodesulfobacteriota bacterium]
MTLHELAGKPAPASILENIPRLITAYYTRRPVPSDPAQQVAFGTSGHRGTSTNGSFNEDHILAISRAICEYRQAGNITGPLFLGIDTHALSEPAMATALEVFAAEGVVVMIDHNLGYTPTPVISHAILTYNNRKDRRGKADGVVVTPSHNPPKDGGFKYNPPHGGPADSAATAAIADRANALLSIGTGSIRRVPFEKAIKAETTVRYDYITPYVADLANVIDMPAIAAAGLKIGVDPLGGSTVGFWQPMAEKYGLSLELVSDRTDPAFSFMTVDKDGKIRMDCSSACAMQRLLGLKDKFDIAFGNDPDGDRHGIVTKSAGLLNPNHYLSVAIWYLFQNRPGWRPDAAVGKTLVSTSMIDRIAAHLKRPLSEVPVGFKWFVEGLVDGSFGFGGEESAGASFLRKDGTAWTTDKDGIIMDLLSAEIMARTGKDPGEIYRDLEEKFGCCVYERMDAPADAREKKILSNLSREAITDNTLAGEPIREVLTRTPYKNSPIGGLKVTAENGWFAARPSGTEDIYKIYAESFRGKDHLKQIQQEAREIVGRALKAGAK